MNPIEHPQRWLPIPRQITPRFSAQLDCMRWVAAFLVCITHTRSLIFLDYTPESGIGWPARAFYLIHGFGHEAVMVFFILSGYLVGGEVLRQFRSGRFSWREYFFRRLTRLYPVYLAALFFGGLMDHTGVRLLHDTGIYTQALDSPMIYYNVSLRLGLPTLLGNLAFCQEILVPTYGSNVPLWSLTNEAWYYVLFPLVLSLCFLPRSSVGKWVSLVVLLATVWFLQGLVLVYFSIWLLGLVPHFLQRPVLRSAWPLLTALVTVMIIVRLRLTADLPVFLWHFTLGGLIVLLLNTLEHRPGPVPAGARLHKSLAAFSYSQYLLHWPLALFACGLTMHYFQYGVREQVNAASLLYYVALLGLIYSASWLLAWFTEFRTGALRAWLASRFTRAAS